MSQLCEAVTQCSMVLRVLLGIAINTLCAAAQVRVNEIHATPVAGEPEWVELRNDGASARLQGWMICDARSCTALPDVALAEGALLVVTRDPEGLQEQRGVIPSQLAQCALPSLNNSTDAVVIRRADSSVVDSVFYRVLVKGRSIERDDAGQWGPSYARDSATCGYVNARVRMRHDLRLAALQPAGPVPHLDIVVQQAGTVTAPSRRLWLMADSVRLGASMPALAPEQSWTWNVPMDALPQRGVVHCMAWLERGDDRSDNDTLDVVLHMPPPTSSVTITEVLFAPTAMQCDYVEVYNGTADTIDLDGWMLVDRSRDTARAAGRVLLPPSAYGVIAVDTTVRRMMALATAPIALVRKSFNIDAGGDEVALLNPSGFEVDRARVDPVMHVRELADVRGVALEKLDPLLIGAELASWTSSGDLRGGTPGRANSVAIDLPKARGATVEVGPEWPRIVRFRHPFRHASMFLRIVTLSGVVVRTLLDNVVAGSDGVVVWDGTDDAGTMLPRGPYVASFTALDATSERVVEAVASIVNAAR